VSRAPRSSGWRRLAKQTADAAGVFRLLAARRGWPGVAVLCYHGVRAGMAAPDVLSFASLHVPADRLDAHLEAIGRLCVPVSLTEVEAALAGGRSLPPRAVHVTFDDGYRSVLTRALPLLERAGVPASVFVCTDPSARRTLLWYDAMARAQGDAAVEALRDGSGTDADWVRVVATWSLPASDDDELATLSPADIARLSTHPLIEIGSHTRTHVPLARVSRDRQADEIAGSLAVLAEWTGTRPRALAYPVGRPGRDVSDVTVACARDAGVQVAFTTAAAFGGPASPALEQPRFVMTDGVDGVELAYRLAWRWRT
jgi:peptidoglycan/xylan/chitin deacetylase (PgdA/CDA1 family)